MSQDNSLVNVCEEQVFEKLFFQLLKSLRDYLYYLSGSVAQSEGTDQGGIILNSGFPPNEPPESSEYSSFYVKEDCA
jgi:hypothetical protein